MNKFAVIFAAAGLMTLAACGEKPEATNTSNEVVENVVENAAVPMENAAENATSNAVENAAE